MFWDLSCPYVSYCISLSADTSNSTLFRYEEHTIHACEHRLCPISCQLCKRLCSGDHLHGLDPDQSHLCGFVCCFFLMNVVHFSLLDKNTLVVLCAPPPAYAK